MLPAESVPKAFQDRIKSTPQCESFMHLHLGFDAEVSAMMYERSMNFYPP